MTQVEGQPSISGITCQEIAQWASAYLDGHIEVGQKGQIAVHMVICAGCETYVKQIAMVRDVMGLLPRAVEETSDLHRLRQAFVARASRPPAGD